MIRIIVFVDKTGEVVKTDVDELLFTPTSISSVRDPIHMNDFRVIMDRTITLHNLNVNTNSSLRYFQMKRSFKRPITCRYLNVTGTNVEENQIYIGFMVGNTLLANSVEINGQAIIHYTDM